MAKKKTSTQMQISTKQKIAIGIALFSGLAAIAAGFVAMPNREYFKKSVKRPVSAEQKKDADASPKAVVETPSVKDKAILYLASGEVVEDTTLIAGDKNIVLMNLDLQQKVDSASLKEIAFSVKSIGAKPVEVQSLKNFRLESNYSVIGAVVAMNNGVVLFSGLDLALQKDENKKIKLIADVVPVVEMDYKTQIGLPFVVSVDSVVNPLKVKYQNSEQDVLVSGKVLSPVFETRRAEMEVMFSTSGGNVSPSGPATASEEQVIAIVDVKNKQNFGSYSSDLLSFSLSIDNNGDSYSSTTLRVYKNPFESFNLLAEKNGTWGELKGHVVFEDALFEDVAISSSSTTKLFVTADTSSFMSPTKKLCVSLQENMLWTDGIKIYSKIDVPDKTQKCFSY